MDLTRFMAIEGEKPLDNLVSDGGFFKIFRSVAVIGDSLSSGEFESCIEGIVGYHDFFEYSWGQFMAREAGNKVYNFSRGGMTAKEYFETYARLKGWWDNYYDAQAFIIALGVNDFREKYPIGTVDEVKDRAKRQYNSFATYLAGIIERYKAKQPNAKFFLMTTFRSSADTPEKTEQRKAHRQLLLDLAEFYDNTYVIDIFKYGPLHDDEFKRNFNLAGHLNPMGYILAGKIVMSYIDYIIRNNPEDFRQVGFIGHDFYNENFKR